MLPKLNAPFPMDAGSQRGIVVFSGGTAANSIVDVFNDIARKRQCPLNYVIPISDNGGSSSELIRVFGGPGIGDIRSKRRSSFSTVQPYLNDTPPYYKAHTVSPPPTPYPPLLNHNETKPPQAASSASSRRPTITSTTSSTPASPLRPSPPSQPGKPSSPAPPPSGPPSPHPSEN